MKEFGSLDIDNMDKRFRTTFINCLSGYKSPFLVGTKSCDGDENLAIFSSVFHLGANPALIGMISRPNSVPRHTLENIKATGLYSLNLVDESFLDKAHQTSARYDREVSEFNSCGIDSAYEEGFSAPFVKCSEMTLLMKHRQIIELEINATLLVIGEIYKVILKNECSLKADGFLDFSEMSAVASVGLDAYSCPKGFVRKAYAKAN